VADDANEKSFLPRTTSVSAAGHDGHSVHCNPDRGDPRVAQGEAISSVSENSRNPGYQVKVGTKNPNGVALTIRMQATAQTIPADDQAPMSAEERAGWLRTCDYIHAILFCLLFPTSAHFPDQFY